MAEEQTNEEVLEEVVEQTADEDRESAFEEALAELGGAEEVADDVADDAEEVEQAADSEQPETAEETPQADQEVDEYELEAKRLREADDVNSIEMPSSWANDKRELWDTLPKEARQYWKKRESDLTKLVQKKVSEYDEASGPLKGVMAELKPMAKKWALGDNPMTLEQGIVRAAHLYEHMKTADKMELAATFLKASGGTIQDLNSKLTGDTGSAKEKELLDRIEQLENRTTTAGQGTNVPAQDGMAASLNTEFARFASTKNAFGGKKYPSSDSPHFAKTMGALASNLWKQNPNASVQAILGEAYRQSGGHMDNGTVQASTSSQTNEQLRAAATNGYSKHGTSAAPAQYDSYDDAFEKAAADLGYFD